MADVRERRTLQLHGSRRCDEPVRQVDGCSGDYGITTALLEHESCPFHIADGKR